MNSLHRTGSIALVIGVHACATTKCDPATATCADPASVEPLAEPRIIELETYGERQKARLARYELQVVSLTPDPVSTIRIEPRQYRLTLRLTDLP